MFSKIGVLKSFAKFTGKHMYQSLSLNKVVGVRNATLLMTPVNFAKIFRTPFVLEHLR